MTTLTDASILIAFSIYSTLIKNKTLPPTQNTHAKRPTTGEISYTIISSQTSTTMTKIKWLSLSLQKQ